MQLTPDTKLGALLDAHPEVEDALIGLVPAFGKLKNPLLRKTVAKLATLEQAARVGGIALPDLLVFLRQQLGQDPHGMGLEAPEPGPAPSEPPTWYRPERVILELEVDALLATGEHPLARVKQTVGQSSPGDIVALRSSFRPEPLLSAFLAEGMQVWCGEKDGCHRTLICKPQLREDQTIGTTEKP